MNNVNLTDNQKANIEFKEKKLTSDRNKSSISFIVKIVLGILFLTLLVSAFTNNTAVVPKFADLLDFLGSTRTIEIPFIGTEFLTDVDWGIFDVFRHFVSFFINILNVVIFVADGLISLVSYIIFFLGFIFGV